MSPSARALLLATLLAGAVVPEPLHAGEPALRLADLVAAARRQNPELQAARDRARAMAFVPDQASALDDPTLSYEAWNVPDSLRVDRADNNIFRIAQKLPFPGKRAARRRGRGARGGAGRAPGGRRRDRPRRGGQAGLLGPLAGARAARGHRARQGAARPLRARRRAALRRRRGDAGGRAACAGRADARSEPAAARAARDRDGARRAERAARPPSGRAARRSRAAARAAPRRVGRSPRRPRARQAAGAAPRRRRRSRARRARTELAHRSYYPDFEVSVGRFVNYGQSDGFGAMASVTLPFVNGRQVRRRGRGGTRQAVRGHAPS